MAQTDSKYDDDETGKSSLDPIRTIVARLDKEADDRVSKREPIEKRWLEDIAQFHGKYSEEIKQDLKEDKKSQLFINQTRPKTNVMESRLSDMLFPTDDRNWGIKPTPVPELTVHSEQAAQKAAKAKLKSAENPEDQQALDDSEDADIEMLVIQERIEQARIRSSSMEEEIDDNLRECNYSAECREVIRDACKLGTGVMKGPIANDRSKRKWQKSSDESNVYTLNNVADEQPAFWRVDLWDFFPDSDAAEMEECEGVFERHRMNRKQLRKLARRPGFDQDAIRNLLRDEPYNTTPTYLADLRSITGSYNDESQDRYHVWEYHGPLSAEDMKTLAEHSDQPEKAKDIEDVDPLDEIEVVIWFCQGELLKFGIHHLDSGDSIYSVFNLEKDEASIFGFGIPYIMRDPQSALAGAWRTLMDNMGLSSGPQIVINEDVVEPYDGEWVIKGRKIWRRKTSASPDKAPFETYDIPSHMDELLQVIEVSKQNIDEETALPMLAQGEQGSQVTKTAQGMSILMNSMNVIFRRIVKNWDDDMTTKNISRMYDWLMQFSEKDYIKGDYQVDARGTSVLLVRETQSTNMMIFIERFVGHGVVGRFIKKEGLPALRKLAKTMMVPADEIIKSDTEIAEDEAKAANDPPPPDPEMEKITMQYNVEKMKGETALAIEQQKRETALIQLAATQNWDLEKLRQTLEDKKKDRDSKERMMAVEAAVTAKEGSGGGGWL